MKRLISLFLALTMLLLPCMVSAEGKVHLDAVYEGRSVEAGDQFMVEIKKAESEISFLTFRVNGEFDADMAELIAPVYTNESLGVLTNLFDNEVGTFTFEGYDQTIRGTKEDVVCSLLFKAKKSGEFNLKLLEDCMLGKADENAFHELEVSGATVAIVDDSDGESVSIIEDTKPLTPFDDMLGYDWAEKAVGVMATLGITEDIADTSFYPGQNITRGEFVTMLVRICKQKKNAASVPFGDVTEDSYQYEEVMTAKVLGVAKGDENGNFRPDEAITRQDVCTLVYRMMLKMNKVNPEIKTEDYFEGFVDTDSIAPYATEPVAGLIRAKILKGDDTKSIRPEDNMTRAEAAVILNSLAEFNILVSRG